MTVCILYKHRFDAQIIQNRACRTKTTPPHEKHKTLQKVRLMKSPTKSKVIITLCNNHSITLQATKYKALNTMAHCLHNAIIIPY
jgi:hypothetical protein